MAKTKEISITFKRSFQEKDESWTAIEYGEKIEIEPTDENKMQEIVEKLWQKVIKQVEDQI
jgi:hypothetical protein